MDVTGNTLHCCSAMLCGFLVCFVASASAQTPDVDVLDQGVVTITAHRSGSIQPDDWPYDDYAQDETGSGFVISDANGVALILTARHIVFGSVMVRVSFGAEKGVDFPAAILPKNASLLDLAVLQVKFPAGVRPLAKMQPYHFSTDHSLRRSQPVWTLNAELEPVPNSVVRLAVDADTREFQYTNNSIGKGFSGAPIFDAHGQVVGIHLKSRNLGEREYGVSVAVKIDAAVETLEAVGYDPNTFNKLLVNTANVNPLLTGEPLERIRAMGLKYDVENFAQAVEDGILPAITAYLDAGMSPNSQASGSDRFVLDLPALNSKDNFPAILKEFQDHKVDFSVANRYIKSGVLSATGDAWFYVDGPETLQDQLWLTLATNESREVSMVNGKALLAAGASPLRAMHAAQNCDSNNPHYCSEVRTFLSAIGYKPGPEPTKTADGKKLDGKTLYEQKQFAQARPLLEASASAGDGHAAALIGTYYAYGLGGTSVEPEEAMRWLVKAAQLGDRDSMRGAGYGYLVGSGVARDYAQSLSWFRKAGSLGDGPSMTAIGYQYFSGLGVSQDDTVAADWFRRAVAAGDTNPAKTLQSVLDSMKPKSRSSTIPGPWDSPEFQAWFIFRNAVLTNNGQDYQELASDFALGKSGATKDPVRAAHYFLLAANLGNTEAMNQLSGIYTRGEGVPQDVRQALSWLQKSANAGDASAQSLLGAEYARGEAGLGRDDRRAVFWFQKAAAGGSPEGMTNLAIMYRSGLGGLPKDMNQAMLWYRKAAALGEPVAQQALKGAMR